MLTDEQLAFARGHHIAVLATVDLGGIPHAAPMWYAVDLHGLVMVTGRASKKHRNLESTGRASVVIDRRNRPYYALMIDCDAELSSDGIALTRSKIAARYLDEPELSTYLDSRRGADSVVVRLTPRSVAVYGKPPSTE